MGDEVTLENPSAAKMMVRVPGEPVSDRLLNAARPLPLVVTLVDPFSVPPPLAIAAVTRTSACGTAFPAASRSSITGCCGKATPLVTVPDGCVTIASRLAGPTAAVAVNVTGEP
jgi:hypothetical protein